MCAKHWNLICPIIELKAKLELLIEQKKQSSEITQSSCKELNCFFLPIIEF